MKATSAQDISWHPNRTLEVNLIKIKLVSGGFKAVKESYFDCLKYIFCMMLKLCYSRDKVASRRGYIWNIIFLDCIQINIPKWTACFFYTIKKKKKKTQAGRQTQQRGRSCNSRSPSLCTRERVMEPVSPRCSSLVCTLETVFKTIKDKLIGIICLQYS